MKWLGLNWPQVVALLGDHIRLVVPAIALSILIAVPVGRLAGRHRSLGRPLLGVATLLYAVPALPLLVILPVVLGLPLRSAVTITAALTIYGVALLVRTAADAFGAVDAGVHEAAVALGYSGWGLFWRVDLPLAVPVLLSGIRVVVVSTVGLATIGALTGQSSLGTLLTDGFQRGIAGEVVTGVVVTVVLALVLDGLTLLVGRAITPWRRVAA
ncbi:MAG: ABC transporter permease subunit [Propionibacteriaceae bacterium]|jgi:osmoprotectant transport system permease protein|nr:ABC transporter permease subunit [Propionibacteriaceae bacterium]